VINNVFDKFSGFSAIGMLVTCLALLAAVLVAFGALSLILGDGKVEGFQAKREAGGAGRPGIGSFYGNGVGPASADDIISAFTPVGDSSLLLRFFGIMPTRVGLGEATRKGMLTFFAVDEDLNPLKTMQSPGFYTVMARSLVRSAVAIVLAFKDLVELIATGNFASSIEQIFEVLETMKTSRFFAAINIFAQLGNNLTGPDVTIKTLDAGKKISELDAVEKAYGKSRIRAKNVILGNPNKLAWATNRTPDALMLPANVHELSLDDDLGSGRLLVEDPLASTRFEMTNNAFNSRISTEKREEIEKKFDSEFMPFYFHDLRTNEILGFHAFLTSLNDDYTANYESIDGFGRVDPVKIYKNTNRKIGISFIIAALDELDFDSMWLKINKLTTMVYPQYTQGKRLGVNIKEKGTYQFTKPFTQQISAAPMIRLRLGDLFRSNYSKFNIARIFGVIEPGASVGGPNKSKVFDESDAAANATTDIGNLQKLPTITDPAFKVKQGYKFRPADRTYNLIDPTASGDRPSQINPYTFGVSPAFMLEITNPLVNDKETGQSYIEAKFVEPDVEDTKSRAAYGQYEVTLLEADEDGEPLNNVLKIGDDNMLFKVSISDLLEMSPSTFKKYREDNGMALKANAEYVTNVKDFINEENNAITRSFRSAGGKGIAGFIESLSFDWYSATWETKEGKRAPKLCKVTMAFAPIHDISPGLAADGYNRAPVYPVGPHNADLKTLISENEI